MKKIFLGAAVLLLLLTACGKAPPLSTEENLTETAASVPSETQLPSETASPETLPEETAQPSVPSESEPHPPAATALTGTTAWVVGTDHLNVRESPSITARKVTFLTGGTEVTVFAEETEGGVTWCQTEEGWVSSAYLSYEKPVPGQEYVPTVTEKPAPPATVPQETVPPATEPQETVPPATVPQETLPPAAEPSTVPSEPAATEPLPEVHDWEPVRQIPAEYESRGYVLCSCGEQFETADAWSVHRDSFLNTEHLAEHTGYSSGSDKIQISPDQVVWKCKICGAEKTLPINENP